MTRQEALDFMHKRMDKLAAIAENDEFQAMFSQMNIVTKLGLIGMVAHKSGDHKVFEMCQDFHGMLVEWGMV